MLVLLLFFGRLSTGSKGLYSASRLALGLIALGAVGSYSEAAKCKQRRVSRQWLHLRASDMVGMQ